MGVLSCRIVLALLVAVSLLCQRRAVDRDRDLVSEGALFSPANEGAPDNDDACRIFISRSWKHPPPSTPSAPSTPSIPSAPSSIPVVNPVNPVVNPVVTPVVNPVVNPVVPAISPFFCVSFEEVPILEEGPICKREKKAKKRRRAIRTATAWFLVAREGEGAGAEITPRK